MGSFMKGWNVAASVFGAIWRVAVVVLAAFVIYRGASICYEYGYRIFTEPAVETGEGKMVTVTITSAMTPKDIGELLEKKGLIKDGKLFILQYYLSEFMKDVNPGTFELSTAMTAEEMMEVMAQDPAETQAAK